RGAERRLRPRERQGVGSGADVPRRPLYDPHQPRGAAGHVDPVRLRRARPPRGPADRRQLFRRGAHVVRGPRVPGRHRLACPHAEGVRMTWEVVIGLETHAQLTTASKIFSGASTQFGAPPNTQASSLDLALPGVLPVPNRGAVERAIRFGLAVNGTINRRSVFARKNYFYPDLPKGYQSRQT